MALNAQEPQIYDVQIGGYSLKLKTAHHPDQVDKLVQFVENKVGESLRSHSNISMQKALILSCLNLAEDYVNLKETATKKLGAIEVRMKNIQNLLESFDSKV